MLTWGSLLAAACSTHASACWKHAKNQEFMVFLKEFHGFQGSRGSKIRSRRHAFSMCWACWSISKPQVSMLEATRAPPKVAYSIEDWAHLAPTCSPEARFWLQRAQHVLRRAENMQKNKNSLFLHLELKADTLTKKLRLFSWWLCVEKLIKKL